MHEKEHYNQDEQLGVAVLEGVALSKVFYAWPHALRQLAESSGCSVSSLVASTGRMYRPAGEGALSDPRLTAHWHASLRAMARGDVCRFTCAAKCAQAWLQSLADCAAPLDRALLAAPAPPRVPPQSRAVAVQLRLDEWCAAMCTCAPAGRRAVRASDT